MKKTIVFGLMGILTALTVAVGAERDVLDNWRNAVSTNDFKKTLASVRRVQEEWPAVHSVDYKGKRDGDFDHLQKEYRNVAKTFLLDLEDYERVLREMPPEAFCEGAEALLDARKRFLKYPSYVNYFLADSISRVVYINLGERLAKVGDVPMCYDKIVERLAESRHDLSQIVELVNGEYGTSQISMAVLEALPPTQQIQAVGKAIGEERLFSYPLDDSNMDYGIRILQTCNLPLLLNRLVISDHAVGGELPAWLSYRKKAEHFSPTDSYQQIRAVLGNEPGLPPTLRRLPGTSVADAASDYLRTVHSRGWRHSLRFADMPVFTKEIADITPPAPVGEEKDALANWKSAVSTNDFQKTLASVKSLKEDWPAVHSVKHKENQDAEKALVQTGYRDVARTFLQGLEAYEKTLQEMSPEAFCEGADILLDVRKRFLKRPSYINYFLADCINRVVYINLGERLVKAGDMPVCYDRTAKRLAEVRCDFPKIANLISGEYGTNRFSMATIEELQLEDKYKAIGNVIGQDGLFFIFPQDMHNLYGLRILGKRSFTALLNRLIMSDHCIGTTLPAFLSYRRKAEHFSPTDSGDEIHAVLGDEKWLYPTWIYDYPPVAEMAANFLRQVQSENWRLMLCFSDPPFFTKEFVEHQEKEEAEREAEREAEQETGRAVTHEEDVTSIASQNLARRALDECGIGARKFKEVHHGYKTMQSFRGSHCGAYAIEISDVDVSKLTSANGWTRGDQLSPENESSVWSAFGWFQGKLKWLPKSHEVKSVDMFVHSSPSNGRNHSVILVRLSDKMVYYLYLLK